MCESCGARCYKGNTHCAACRRSPVRMNRPTLPTREKPPEPPSALPTPAAFVPILASEPTEIPLTKGERASAVKQIDALTHANWLLRLRVHILEQALEKRGIALDLRSLPAPEGL